MADWDVVSVAPIAAPAAPPAAVNDPWAVKNVAPIPPKGFWDTQLDDIKHIPGDIAALGDTALSTLSHATVGAVGTPIARIGARAVAAITGQDPDALADKAGQYVNDQLVYHTRTPGGQAATDQLQQAAAPIGNAIDTARHAVETKAGELGGPEAQALTHTAIGTAADFATAAPVAGVAGTAVRGLKEASAATRAAETAAELKTPVTEKAGFRSAEDHSIARDVAGTSGKDALVLHNQKIGNTVVGSDAGVPHGTDLSYEALEAAQKAPNSVYGRVAAALGQKSELSPAARTQVESAGNRANRITKGTPDAVAKVTALKDELLSAKDLSGDRIVNELRGLRQEGYTNIASEDVSNQQLGSAQLDMARGLEQHITDALPKDGDVSLEQLKAARTALAKNYAVKGALRGKNVDLQAIARIQREDPELLTGGLKAAADFANENPTVTGLASKVYSPPSYTKDVMGVPGTHSIENFLSPSFWAGLGGGKVAARRILTGDTEKALQGARETFPDGLGDEFAPIPTKGPQPPPGMTAETPPVGGGPRAVASPGDIPLADLLAHGVEQPPAQGLSLVDMLAPKREGLPFQQDADFLAGGLELAPETPRGAIAASNADLGSVMSQGVPEGIMQRSTPQHEPSLFDLISGNRIEKGTSWPKELPPAKPPKGSKRKHSSDREKPTDG